MAVFQNTSAIAVIGDSGESLLDRDEINTIHASDMADLTASYRRSTALVVNTSDLHVIYSALRGELPQEDSIAAERLSEIIRLAILDGGLR